MSVTKHKGMIIPTTYVTVYQDIDISKNQWRNYGGHKGNTREKKIGSLRSPFVK